LLANATGANIGFDVERLLIDPRAVLTRQARTDGDQRSLLPLLFSDPRGPAARTLLARQVEDMM
jgi:hypothetical protein